MTPPRLILIPGMGADERMFAPQLAAFPDAECAAFIKPNLLETIPDYAKRFGESLGLRDGGKPPVIVGASFGGFVASEMARTFDVRALVLIGSAASASELPPHMRLSRSLAAVLNPLPLLAPWVARLVLDIHGPSMSPFGRTIAEMISSNSPAFFYWACGAVMRWRKSDEPIRGPIYHIHGTRDRMLPIRFAKPTQIISDAGHVISMSHGKIVNAFIAKAIDESSHAGV